MTVEEFAVQLRRHRERAELTQQDLATKVGLSYQAIQSYESTTRPKKPSRPNTIRIARLVKWPNIDDALSLLGYELLDDTERNQPRDEARELLDQLWPSLTEEQRSRLVALVASMVTHYVSPPRRMINRGLRITPGAGDVPVVLPDPRNKDGSNNDV
jgi:transcriptional regulator with XRE-family HTH domain